MVGHRRRRSRTPRRTAPVRRPSAPPRASPRAHPEDWTPVRPAAQPLGPPPVQLTATGGRASSAAQVAGSATPLGAMPWALWKDLRLAVVCEPKLPVTSWDAIALARCSCIHSTWSPLRPARSSGYSEFGVTLVSGASGAARVLQPLVGVSCQSQKDQPVAP